MQKLVSEVTYKNVLGHLGLWKDVINKSQSYNTDLTSYFVFSGFWQC